MWTDIARKQHAREGQRYSSDLTDAEWAVLEPLLPPRSRLGRPPEWSRRVILNGLFYILRGGVPWRMLPWDFPTVSTVQRYFYAWRDSGLWTAINHAFVMAVREEAGRDVAPAFERREQNEEIGGPIPFIVVIVAGRATGLRRDRHAGFRDELF